MTEYLIGETADGIRVHCWVILGYSQFCDDATAERRLRKRHEALFSTPAQSVSFRWHETTKAPWYDPITRQPHIYDQGVCSSRCSVHQRVCDPWEPVTFDDLLTLAARDSSLDDGAFRAMVDLGRSES